MSQIYDEEGNVIPVTLLSTGECNVLQVKTKEKDGYSAVKLGFKKLPERKVKKLDLDSDTSKSLGATILLLLRQVM